jgi:serine acetyltransferase
VVLEEVPENQTVVGMPARPDKKLKIVEDEEYKKVSAR